MKRNQAYTLINSVIILGMLATIFGLQNLLFQAQLKAQNNLIAIKRLEIIQLKSSCYYNKTHRQQFMMNGCQISVEGHDIIIENPQNKKVVRELITK